MAAAIPFVMLAMSAVSAVGQMQQGEAAQESANFQAAQQDQQAGQQRAIAQRQAIEQRRRSDVMQSRALAVAGASGAGVSDPTVINELADIDRVGEFNALTALYQGEESATGLEMAADSARRTGVASQQAGRLQAGSTLIGGATSFGERYGGSSFDAGSSNKTPSKFSVNKA